MTSEEIISKLKELDFPRRLDITEMLNKLEIENLSGNRCKFEDFTGQIELGSESNIPHYQLAVRLKTICRKSKLLEAIEKSINGFRNVETQFNYEEMKEYCTKEQRFLSEEYSGKIFKKLWQVDFLEKKPNLRKVIENPYRWQKFLKEEVLRVEPEDRIMDWIIDPVGNTGKSTFARAYCSSEQTDAILMKIDNLDRMELSLIQKINSFKDKHSKDPRVIFFDFPRASDMTLVINAIALMEDCKSGYLETNFNGKHKEISISDVHVIVLSNTAPDLSVLSVDRWRLWRLGGQDYDHIIWPCRITPILKDYNKLLKMVVWCVKLINYSPDEILVLDQYKVLIFLQTGLLFLVRSIRINPFYFQISLLKI